MLIGLTYDLRDDYLAEGFSEEASAEFDAIETIVAIEQTLISLGYEVERIGNVKSLVQRLANNCRWDMVFNICEGVSGIGREAQVPCLLEAYNIPYVFSTPEVMSLTMDKAIAKQIVRNVGINTPTYMVVRNIADLEQFYKYSLSFPLFAKPIAEGTGKGIDSRSQIEEKASLYSKCENLLATYKQPVLIEQYLSGRDLTVGIIGTGDSARVVGVLETRYKEGVKDLNQTLYNKENCAKVLDYYLITDDTAKRAAQIALKCWQALGCRDGGRVDLRCDKFNVPHFLEVNPLAGLKPGYSDLAILAEKAGTNYQQLIKGIMDSALSRYKVASYS